MKWADAPKDTKLAITLASGGSFCSLNFGRVPSLAAAAPLIANVCAGPRPNVTGSGPGYLMPQWIQGKVHEGDATPYNPVDHPRVVRAHQIALLKDMVATACTGTHLVVEPFRVPEDVPSRVVLETCPSDADPERPWGLWVSPKGTRVCAPAKIFIPQGPLTLLDMQMAQQFVDECVGKARVLPGAGATSIPCFVLTYDGDLYDSSSDVDLDTAKVLVPWQVTVDGVEAVYPQVS
jgi:hypothetical protein